jgi:hypothetical protein
MLTRLAAIPIAAAVVALAVTAPASAGAAGARTAGHGRVGLSTLISHLRVRDRPSIRAKVTGRLGREGSMVRIDCWASGTRIAGNPVWYHVASPHRGYVTSYYLNSHLDPVTGMPRCSQFRRYYRTLVAGLRVRSRPALGSDIRVLLGGVGSKVTVDCYAVGHPVGGDRIWYHLVTPLPGYVTGLHLNTGFDPAAGVPHC